LSLLKVNSFLDEQLEEINKNLSKKNVEEILLFLKKSFSEIAVLTAFGYSGIVLLDFIKKIIPATSIIFIDTRRHFPETLKLKDYYLNEIGLNIRSIQTHLSEVEIMAKYGKNLEKRSPDLCCSIRKVNPLLKILPEKVIWISALRKDQSSSRANLQFIEKDGRGTIKIYPLINWSKNDVWKYIRSKNLKYNVLHDKNYPSVGCFCCTTKVNDGEAERSGRWTSIPKFECGIHQHLKKTKKNK